MSAKANAPNRRVAAIQAKKSGSSLKIQTVGKGLLTTRERTGRGDQGRGRQEQELRGGGGRGRRDLGSDDDEQEAPSDYVQRKTLILSRLVTFQQIPCHPEAWLGSLFSTVWLCWDLQDKKLLHSRWSSQPTTTQRPHWTRFKLSKCVRETDENDALRERTVMLLDDQDFRVLMEPHVCMVFEVLGTIYSSSSSGTTTRGCLFQNVKIVMKQVLEGTTT